jgi:hypothetical protein
MTRLYTVHSRSPSTPTSPGKPVVLYLQPPPPASEYGSEVSNNRLQHLLQNLEAYELNEELPTVTGRICQDIFDSHALVLHLQNNGSLGSTAVIGEPPVAIHRVAYIFLRDLLHHHLSTSNQLSMSHIPRGVYDWIPPPAVVPPEVDLNKYEAGT